MWPNVNMRRISRNSLSCSRWYLSCLRIESQNNVLIVDAFFIVHGRILRGPQPLHFVLLFAKPFRIVAFKFEHFLEARFAVHFAFKGSIASQSNRLGALGTSEAGFVIHGTIGLELLHRVHGFGADDTRVSRWCSPSLAGATRISTTTTKGSGFVGRVFPFGGLAQQFAPRLFPRCLGLESVGIFFEFLRLVRLGMALVVGVSFFVGGGKHVPTSLALVRLVVWHIVWLEGFRQHLPCGSFAFQGRCDAINRVTTAIFIVGGSSLDPLHLVLFLSKPFRVISFETKHFLKARFAIQVALQRGIIAQPEHLVAFSASETLLVVNRAIGLQFLHRVHSLRALDTRVALWSRQRLTKCLGLGRSGRCRV
eukprot:m.7548 g.7548  ORF g.7548 m.7548 type:complete len:366 (+) comp2454_c0_seq1:195-1292(+)